MEALAENRLVDKFDITVMEMESILQPMKSHNVSGTP
jgi:hypothetical protein